MRQFDYVKPRTLAEASATLRELDGKGKIIAGGTGLLPSLKQGLHFPKSLVDLTSISELKRISNMDSDGLSIGANTPLAQVGSSRLIKTRYPALAEAASGVASRQIRTRATIGGNLCLDTRCWYYNQSDFWRSSYPDCRKAGGGTCYVVRGGSRCFALMSSDLVPPLIAVGAELEIFRLEVTRTLPLEDFFTGDGANPLKLSPGDVLTRVILPPKGNTLLSFRKYSLHPPVSFGLVTQAAAITTNPDSRVVQQAKLVLGCLDSLPIRCSKVEAFLVGTEIDSVEVDRMALVASQEVAVFSNVNAGLAYKKRIVEWLVSETLAGLPRRRQTMERGQP